MTPETKKKCARQTLKEVFGDEMNEGEEKV